MKYIKQINLTNAGAETSNGVFSREEGDLTWFYNSEGSHIEPTVEGWFLIDKTLNEQTYMFDFNFENVIPVGDCIEPAPNFELVYSEI
jgi:hypothetical protein